MIAGVAATSGTAVVVALTARELVGSVGAVAAALLAVAGVTALIWRGSRKVGRILDFLAGEMRPNGGSSLRDAVNRLESKLMAVEATEDARYETLNMLRGHYVELSEDIRNASRLIGNANERIDRLKDWAVTDIAPRFDELGRRLDELELTRTVLATHEAVVNAITASPPAAEMTAGPTPQGAPR